MNVFDEHGFRVILDYGHNEAAVGAMVDLGDRLKPRRRRIVGLTCPGDRRDEDATAIAAKVAGHFDTYICHYLPPRRQSARSRARRSARAVARRPDRRGRRARRDQHHRRGRKGPRRGARAGAARRFGAVLLRGDNALLEADHPLHPEIHRARTGVRRKASGNVHIRRSRWLRSHVG
ncbi:hypothetical protein LH162_18080 [Mycobacterium ulcerans]|nr:hypothetical protein LH162_18080 [Mycobacterium ulcerans]